MLNILTIFGLRVVIYPNDYRPAHVHVIRNGCEAMFNLHCPGGPSELRENYGYSRKEITKITDELSANLTFLCFNWGKIHDCY